MLFFNKIQIWSNSISWIFLEYFLFLLKCFGLQFECSHPDIGMKIPFQNGVLCALVRKRVRNVFLLGSLTCVDPNLNVQIYIKQMQNPFHKGWFHFLFCVKYSYPSTYSNVYTLLQWVTCLFAAIPPIKQGAMFKLQNTWVVNEYPFVSSRVWFKVPCHRTKWPQRPKHQWKQSPYQKGNLPSPCQKGNLPWSQVWKNQKATDTPWKKEQVAAQKKASYKEVTE